MTITLIGSLKRSALEMEKAKEKLEKLGNTVYSPSEQTTPMYACQKEWVEHIYDSDLVIVVSKTIHFSDDNGGTEITQNIGESTSYEMAIADYFNKPILFWY